MIKKKKIRKINNINNKLSNINTYPILTQKQNLQKENPVMIIKYL